MLKEAYENREALEDRIAQGKRNRKEAGNKYGMIIHVQDATFSSCIPRLLTYMMQCSTSSSGVHAICTHSKYIVSSYKFDTLDTSTE